MATTQESPLTKFNEMKTENPFFQFDHPFGSEDFQRRVKELENKHNEFHKQFQENFNSLVNQNSIFKNNSFFNNQLEFDQDNNVNMTMAESSSQFNNAFDLKNNFSAVDDKQCTIKEEDLKYVISLNLEGFDARDVNIRLVEDNELVLEAKRGNNQFKRTFKLPYLTDMSNIQCTKTVDNRLVISIEKEKHLLLSQATGATIGKNATNGNSANNNVTESTVIKTSSNDKKETIAPPSAAVTPRAVKTIYTHKGPEPVFDSGIYKKGDEKKVSRVEKDLYNNLNIFPATMGLFFDESSLKDSHNDYHSAVKDILTSSQKLPSNLVEDMKKYHSIRSSNNTQNTRAVRHTEDAQAHKIVLDVKGYNVDNLKIRIDVNNTLVIEGQFLDTVTGLNLKKSFKHMFNVSSYDTENVSSALSQDGVLTVRIQKKNAHTTAAGQRRL